jgi:hypothetical protein
MLAFLTMLAEKKKFILNFMEQGFSIKHSLKPLYIKSLLNRIFCFRFVLIRRFGVLFVCCTAGGSSQWFKEKRKKKDLKKFASIRPSVRQKYWFNFLSETVQSLRNNKDRRKKGGKKISFLVHQFAFVNACMPKHVLI